MKKRHFSGLMLIIAMIIISSFKLNTTGYKVGDKAMDFKLKDQSGKMVTLSGNTSAKGFIVVFTCNHCPFSKLYEDRIIALNTEFASKGYPIVAVNPTDPSIYPDDSYDNMVSRAKEKDYAFPYLVDETQSVAKAYGATNTPHVFVLQKEKDDLVVKYIGAIDDNAQDATKATKHYVEDAVNALLAGKPVPVTETKAIGCGIKWKNS